MTGGILACVLLFLGAGCAGSSSVGTAPQTPGAAPQPAAPAPAAARVQLPSNVPSDVPTAPNSELINTSVSQDQKRITLTLVSQDRSETVLASLKQQLTQSGFAQTSDTSAGEASRVILFKKGTVTMGITLLPQVDVTNYVVERDEP
jgi:hypothetical protein